MTVVLKKVEGGFQLFVPDELASQVGLREGVTVVAEVMAEMLLIQQPEFVHAAREAMYDRMTPDLFPAGQDHYPPPPGLGLERAG